jgi:hypothetical protein
MLEATEALHVAHSTQPMEITNGCMYERHEEEIKGA